MRLLVLPKSTWFDCGEKEAGANFKTYVWLISVTEKVVDSWNGQVSWYTNSSTEEFELKLLLQLRSRCWVTRYPSLVSDSTTVRDFYCCRIENQTNAIQDFNVPGTVWSDPIQTWRNHSLKLWTRQVPLRKFNRVYEYKSKKSALL